MKIYLPALAGCLCYAVIGAVILQFYGKPWWMAAVFAGWFFLSIKSDFTLKKVSRNVETSIV